MVEMPYQRPGASERVSGGVHTGREGDIVLGAFLQPGRATPQRLRDTGIFSWECISAILPSIGCNSKPVSLMYIY